MKLIRLICMNVLICIAIVLSAEGQTEDTYGMPQGPGLESTPLWSDVHGAGSQRSDPKTGDPEDFSQGHGPQGDAIRILNMVRPVRLISKKELPYTIVGTNQTSRFNESGILTNTSQFYGQDADYPGIKPAYRDNGDGTVSDLNTGLMWQQEPGIKMTRDEAAAALEAFTLGGYDDWRIPSIKELYSLIQFSGRDVAPEAREGNIPFINTDYFHFEYGDVDKGERIIDSQYLSSTCYVSTTMNGMETVFGVNFADGRIKGYGLGPRGDKEFYVIFVRGNRDYGVNRFVDNGDGTVSDLATGLMWMQNDLGPMNWKDALESSEKLDFAGYTDWRLPDVKELQSIVDYSRSPETTNSAAIDPVFNSTPIVNEAGEEDYAFYWSSTTHARASKENPGTAAAYVSFGRSLGNMAALQRPERSGNMMPPPSQRD